jgi:hypothetical protein
MRRAASKSDERATRSDRSFTPIKVKVRDKDFKQKVRQKIERYRQSNYKHNHELAQNAEIELAIIESQAARQVLYPNEDQDQRQSLQAESAAEDQAVQTVDYKRNHGAST